MTLPIPDKQYPDWSRFLSAVWMYASSVRNIDPQIADDAVDRAAESIRDSIVERNEARNIRPSSFVACGRQAYFMLKGEEPHKMPDNIGSTFAVGHLLHELAYAAVKSAMPEGILVETERVVDLPDWWPTLEGFNQSGHVDMVLTVTDIEAALPFLPKDVIKRHTQMLVDFKTMGSFSVRKHSKAVFGDDPDAFGYMAQLAIYTDALGIADNGALLVGKDDADPVWAHYRKRLPTYTTTSDAIPYVFQQYLVHGADADMLFAEGQHDKGNSALQLAEQLILNELDLVERQQSQENHVRVLTHVGQQSRI